MQRHAILFLAALVLGAVIWNLPPGFPCWWVAVPFLWVLPGLAWASLIPRAALDRAERVAVGLGLSFAVTPATILLTSYLPGPLTRVPLIVATVGVVGLPAAISGLLSLGRGWVAKEQGQQRSGGVDAPRSGQHRFWQGGWAWLLVALLIAAGLRVVNLGYSEFQGDEAAVMVRAARALEGDEAVIFEHKKGPAELTVVMGGWCLAGVTNERMARLPFAWASILGVAAVFLCGRRLGHPHAGGMAACLLAIEGYLVGFGRIVQYQSLVFVLSALGLLCLLAYHSRGRGSLVIVGGALFGGGSLAHYDAVLALPAGLVLVCARVWLDRRRTWRAVTPVVVAAVVGTALMGLFYFPFLRSPRVASTAFYLLGRTSGGHGPYNNLQPTFELTGVYDAVYFLAAMLLALVGQTVVTWGRWGRVGLGLSGLLLASVGTGFVRPALLVVDSATLAWMPAAFLFVGAVLAPGQSAGTRALWVWLGLPALFYLFFVASPLTHVYTVFPAWAMLAGLGMARTGGWLAGRSKNALRVASAGGVAAYALCGFYAIMLFVDHSPEYLRTFPRFEDPLYWTPYDQMPETGLFGFPYRAGWKVVGALMDEEQLVGSYDSNEEREVTDYYTHQAVRLDCASPDMYVTAVNVQDEVCIRWDQIEAEYQPAIVVTVGGEPKLRVYVRDATGPPLVYRAEEYDRPFDLGSTSDQVATSALEEKEEVRREEYVAHEAALGDFVRLLGYKIDTRHATPGGYVELTLLWQALGPAPVDYQMFTHLYDGEMMRGQLDSQPICGNRPTSRWHPGELIADPRRIPVWDDAPAGPVPLTIGMYDLATMHRLTVSTPKGVPSGDKVHLTDVVIRAP